MANILVFIEINSKKILPSSFRALEEGRMLSSSLGATLYAILSVNEINTSNQDLLYQISAYKPDKIIVASSPIINGPTRIATEGTLLSSIAREFPPNVMLFGESAAAIGLASFISAQIHGIFAREYRFYKDENSFTLELIDDFALKTTLLVEDEIENPVVAIVEGHPLTVPGITHDLEVIAFENDFSQFEKDYFSVVQNYRFDDETLLVAGLNSIKYGDQLKKLSLEKEWSLLSTKQFQESFPVSGISPLQCKSDVAGKTKFILFGLTTNELLVFSRFISHIDKLLLVECEDSKIDFVSEYTILKHDHKEVIIALEESYY